jgi:hypothetical protein
MCIRDRHQLPKNSRGAKKEALFGTAQNLIPEARPNKPEVRPQYVLAGSNRILAAGTYGGSFSPLIKS